MPWVGTKGQPMHRYFTVLETNGPIARHTHEKRDERFGSKEEADVLAEKMARDNLGKFFVTFEAVSCAYKAPPMLPNLIKD